MADDDGNGRVTMAVLAEKLDNLDGKVSAVLADAKEGRKERETLGTRVTRIEERMTIWGAMQAAYTTIAAALAGFLGTRQ